MTSQVRQDLEALLASIHPYPVPAPGSGFDPQTASNAQLEMYGLLARPDQTAEPERYAFWERLLPSRVQVVTPVFPTADELLQKHPRPEPEPAIPVAFAAAAAAPGPPPVPSFRRHRSSQNWSGAYITPVARPNRFVQVVGAWDVPEARVPLVPPSGTKPDAADYRSSTWIGLGGQRPYNSLPQIGTSQHIAVKDGETKREYAAWWQWWIKDRLGYGIPVDISNFPVQPGDEILASVKVDMPNDVHFILMNRRTMRLVAFKVRAPAGIKPLGPTSEWIHERPAEPTSLYPLPKCSDVVFRHCLAWSAPETVGPTVLQTLDSNAKIVKMVDIFDTPHRSAPISVSRRTSATSVLIRYREAGG